MRFIRLMPNARPSAGCALMLAIAASVGATSCTTTKQRGRSTEVTTRNKPPQAKATTATLGLVFARDDFHPQCLDLDRGALTYTLTFGTVTRRGDVPINGGNATLVVKDLPAQNSSLNILIFDDGVPTLEADTIVTLATDTQPSVTFSPISSGCQAATAEPLPQEVGEGTDGDPEININVELPQP